MPDAAASTHPCPGLSHRRHAQQGAVRDQHGHGTMPNAVGSPVLLMGCCVCGMLDEEPCQIHMTMVRCHMQWSGAILVPGCSVCAVLDEGPCLIQMTHT